MVYIYIDRLEDELDDGADGDEGIEEVEAVARELVEPEAWWELRLGLGSGLGGVRGRVGGVQRVRVGAGGCEGVRVRAGGRAARRTDELEADLEGEGDDEGHVGD